MRKVLITGADRGVGYALAELFAINGWKVFAGQFMPEWKQLEGLKKRFPDFLELLPLDVSSHESVEQAIHLISKKTDILDMLVNVAGISQSGSRDAMLAVFRVNTIGPIQMVEAALPLMKSGMKRICIVSSEAGSISVAHRKECSAYCMSKTALNMAARLMFNQLQKEGYSFRLYHPGWVRSYMQGAKSANGYFEPEDAAITAYKQFTTDRTWEDTLVMTDVLDMTWPF